ncbi:MAG: DUF1287 domain-containing protein [Candidatus Adiutrix sp.]|jgi:uncharacterized protein YijF (DUF1287 family)|nr:DUF1287 domain-containing protein [Candidatus Adiutrix sp.]
MNNRRTYIASLSATLCLGLFLLGAPLSGDTSGYLVGSLKIPRQVSSLDTNANGLNDTDDIIAGARLEASRKPVYKSAYYVGGYPPETEGVCTDVIWRAFSHAGYDLKKMVDADIKANRAAYPRTNGKPDPHIDFRRVPNLCVFFKRHGQSLGTAIDPGDPVNMAQWQPGDIVSFQGPDHIAILSDQRNEQGVPLLLHNDGPWASEADDFMFWYDRGCTGHFRYPKK